MSRTAPRVRSGRHLITLALACLATCALVPTAAQAQAPCSASNGTGGTSRQDTYAVRTQQSFTAPCTGRLSSMTFTYSNTADDFRSSGYFLVVSLKDAAGTTTLATRPRTDDIFPGATRTYDFSAANVTLTAGTQYRWEIAVSPDSPNPNFQVFLLDSYAGNPYAGGQLYQDGATNADRDAGRWSVDIFATVAQTGLFNPTSAPGDGAGYRLLGAPVAGFTVRDLAALNLVQGVPAGASGFPAQYPLAGYNVLPTYTGGGSTFAAFPRPTGTDLALAPGRGFFWYLYDRAIPASSGFGGGTSASRELSGFTLSASNALATANVAVPFADNVGDNFQMLANPFARPLAVSGLSATGGTIQGTNVVYAYNPNGNAYVALTSTARLAVWQGVFAELVPTAAGQAVTVTYAYGSTDTGAAPTFYGKDAEATADAGVRFTLDGTLANGAHVADDAALVRLVDGAQAGWDAFDASKPTPPGADLAMLAPTIDRDGVRYALGVDSRAPGVAAAVPLALTTSSAGTFTLAWTATLPEGWTATLADTQTGQTVDLATATDLPFSTSGATAASERFVLTLRPAGATATGDAPALALGLTAPAPNPATSRAALVLTLPTAEHVRAVVVDALGREVAVLLDAEAAGTVRLDVDTARLAPGVYTVRATGASFVLAKRLTVVR